MRHWYLCEDYCREVVRVIESEAEPDVCDLVPPAVWQDFTVVAAADYPAWRDRRRPAPAGMF